ncbi:uracil-DNA glycosylase family protein [Aquimarina sp. BL5]|uniref:uracil-DNA glycosylase family protein n=1 Tax=Aquimarina sp. BL5 TaxID=1714860 RepID=UPI000E548AFF|nr:uracil-DNA glycosylase family protein [Aquimarina sp. BL5]AXT53185.1 uracil-DNA glycosylase family protein [Aquimarina sp. BL5]RKM96903.1 uracil-DNA glycosylase family protein [Aquimarina sp. BL5]
MFQHTHPYEPFFPEGATKLIVGTLPPPRFTSGELKKGDVDFCYGSISGLLWPVLDRIFDLNLKFETTLGAVNQRKNFLASRGIGVCDIVHSCKRDKIDASDLGMQYIELRDVVSYLHQYPKIDTLLFTGGNSKNGPEYFFRKHLKDYQLQLALVSNDIPRIHSFQLEERTIKTVSLTAPSGAANRSIGSLQSYKDQKNQNPTFNTIDFRVMQYREFF